VPLPTPACFVCGASTTLLQVPFPCQAMLSDGSLVGEKLLKMSCGDCGAALRWGSRAPDRVRAPFSASYGSGSLLARAESARGKAYAAALLERLGDRRISRVLDVGCGKGDLLQALGARRPALTLVGIEPAGHPSDHPGLRIEQGFVETMPLGQELFDLVVAVNVLEHTADPTIFLEALGKRLAPAGIIAIVCPDARTPNLELLVWDHLQSLTPGAIERVAARAGLSLLRHEPLPEIGDFDLFLLTPGSPGSDAEPPSPELAAARHAYLGTWADLDARLLERTDGAARLCAFGAGETAALLRAYAPRTWGRIESLVVDDPRSAWSLNKPVAENPASALEQADAILLAVHPRTQPRLFERLYPLTRRPPIVWHDLVPR
jgi:SAM-dependent methyltransferase